MTDNFAASYAAWAEAFSIFARNEPDALYEVAAEHDIIYAGRGEGYSDADKARLQELGWEYDDDLECYYNFV